jgi:purine-binding chemotaxis protein CheW
LKSKYLFPGETFKVLRATGQHFLGVNGRAAAAATMKVRRPAATERVTSIMSEQVLSAAVEARQPIPGDLTIPSEPNGATTPNQLISFAIGDDQYGVDIMAVREIKGWTAITSLPKQPEYVRGVLNLRGVIVPIVDLRCRFGQGLTEATPMHIVIIVQIASKPVGLLADRVLDIVSLDASQVKPVPRVAQAQRLNFLCGLATTEGAMIALIDLPNLLTLNID